MLTVGIKGKSTVTVTPENCADVVGSGSLKVFATPAMIALMEKTALESVQEELGGTFSTVGTLINITHDAPTPVGMNVTCESTLIEIDKRRLVFDVACYDDSGKIGGGRHERFIVDPAKFQTKADAKLAPAEEDEIFGEKQ